MIKNDFEAELREVMDIYGKTVYAIACAQLSSRAEADDVFQDVFLLYYTKELYFENEAARKAWLIRTTINLCRRANRSPWNRSSSEDTDNIADTTELKTAEEAEVWNAVRELKEKYFLPVYLYYFENMPVSEISRALGLKDGAVQMRLTRARRILKKDWRLSILDKDRVFVEIREKFTPNEGLKEEVLARAEKLTPGRKTMGTDKKELNTMSIEHLTEHKETADMSEYKKRRGGAVFAAAAACMLLIAGGYSLSRMTNDIENDSVDKSGTQISSPAEENPVLAYKEQNPDTVGYISIPGLKYTDGSDCVSYPVVRDDGNGHYLTHDFYGNYSESGAINIGSDNKLDSDIIWVFGHNMSVSVKPDGILPVINDNGELRVEHPKSYDDSSTWDYDPMFAALPSYMDIELVRQYPIIEFTTLDGITDEYIIFSAAQVNMREYVENYPQLYNAKFEDDDTFLAWWDFVCDTSYFDCSISAGQSEGDYDDFLVLNTKTDDGNSFKIIAKKLTSSDDKAAIIDSYKVKSDMITVPDLTGMDANTARSALEELGFVPVSREAYSDTISYGNVMKTEPAAGELLAEGSEVMYFISRGEMGSLYLDVDLTGVELNGSYTFDVYAGDTLRYTKAIANAGAEDIDSVGFELSGEGKEKLTVFVKSHDFEMDNYILYGLYYVDYDAKTVTLDGRLNKSHLQEVTPTEITG